MAKTILEVRDLRVSFQVYGGEVQAVRGVNFQVKEGEAVAIVGESGSGKSVTAQAIMRLIPTPPARIKEGAILLEGQDLAALSEKEMQKVRGNKIGMIFQDPMTSLNPTMTIGMQIMEGLIQHQRLSKSAAKERAIELLAMVGISNPETRIKQYPHQMSGGMRQRVMIAMALAAHRRRTDHGAGRDDSGANFAAHEGASAENENVDHSDHARFGHCGRTVRSRDRHVRGTNCGNGNHAGNIPKPATSVHERLAQVAAAAQPGEGRTARSDLRDAAGHDSASARLRVLQPVQRSHGHL